MKRLLSTQERVPVRTLFRELKIAGRKTGARLPSRAAIYQFMAHAPVPEYPPARLPQAVRSALYNLDPRIPVPGRQLAFYCFNYGDLAAMSFAAGLPWLALYQAARMRGYRPKSRGLLEAALRARGI